MQTRPRCATGCSTGWRRRSCGAEQPTPLSVAQLADRVRHDEDFRSVLDCGSAATSYDLAKTIATLVADEHVPYLAAQRYKESGLRKRPQWERTWALQRREDAGEKRGDPGAAEVHSADFTKPSYWRARGKLDVPKERFISYPHAGRDERRHPAARLGRLGPPAAGAGAGRPSTCDRKTEAAGRADRLLPLLAGLAELEPWLQQWYADPRPGFLGSPAEFFTGLIDTELSALNTARPTLTTLRGLT